MNKQELTGMLKTNLQKYIQKTDKTPKEICEEMGIPYPTFMQWTEGRSYPSIERISLIADYFHVTMAELIQENPLMVRCADCGFYCKDFKVCEQFSRPDWTFYAEEQDFCSFGIKSMKGA